MKFHWLLPLVSATLNVLLGAIVVGRNPRSSLHRAFFLMSLALALWNLNNFAFYAVRNPTRALWWAEIFRTGTLVLPTTVLQLVVTFSTTAPTWSKWALCGSYLLAATMVAANFLGCLVAGVTEYPWGLYPIGTKVYGIFIVAAVLNGVASIYLLLRESRLTDSPRRKVQARFWLLGALIALPAAMANFLPMYGIRIYPIGHLGNALYAATTAYAIARHRLMDIDLVVSKGAAYLIGSLALIVPAFTATVWLQFVTFGSANVDFSFAVLAMFVLVGLFFPVIRLRAESRLERSIAPERHENRAALDNFVRSIVRILDHDKLLRELANTLRDHLEVSRVSIGLMDNSHHICNVDSFHGEPSNDNELEYDMHFVRYLSECQRPFIIDELLLSSDSTTVARVLEYCNKNDWEVCIPLHAPDRFIGFIALGRKRTMEPFSASDMVLLETLGAEASVALENARLYSELRQSREIIRRADRLSALGILAAGIAHEIRNPLVSIQTFFQLAPDRLQDEEFRTSFMPIASDEVQRISGLVTELLQFARSPSRDLQEIDLNDLVERVSLILEPEARKHHLGFVKCLSTHRLRLSADAAQLTQVIINLALNAIQATPAKGTVSISTHDAVENEGHYVEIEIRDTGSGISAAQLDHIFDPFFTTKDSGTGLGLSIAHQIISEHGGNISVESAVGVGTCFVVRLPGELGSNNALTMSNIRRFSVADREAEDAEGAAEQVAPRPPVKARIAGS